jgi:pSer/pThr/pTyr-binding forkhead associated (FHA) protein
MRKESEPTLKAGQPALIVTCGNTTRKYRALDRDLLLLGRAASCDVALSCPGIASVHCIIFRSADGWRIRDCAGGRSPTRINGRPIQEQSLHDTDVLQVGTFCFEVRLPLSRSTPLVGAVPAVDDRLMTRLKHLQRARRNLARLALKMRHRSRRNLAAPPTLAELERQAESLRGMQRAYQELVSEYQARLALLEKTEREVCDAREDFERECAERQTRLEQAEYDMIRRQAAEEDRIQLCWEECQQRCQQAEQEARRTASDHERAAMLDRRSAELGHFARHLRRLQQQMAQQATLAREDSRANRERTTRQDLRDRLAQLTRLREELARSNSPSAPGSQLRGDAERLNEVSPVAGNAS